MFYVRVHVQKLNLSLLLMFHTHTAHISAKSEIITTTTTKKGGVVDIESLI